jgi:hypothetical protein
VAEVAAGVLLNVIALIDMFNSVVLPRPAINKFAIGGRLFRVTWRAWRWLARLRPASRHESWLAAFAPTMVVFLFALWALALIVGYALVLYGVRDQIRPVPTGFDALYFSGGTLIPLNYGDFVPIGPVARLSVISEEATGIATAAIAITLLFSLSGAFQRREEQVVALDAMSGAPPSGLQILETAATYNMRHRLNDIFETWRAWTAAVLESHLAYPVLFYFRSSHDNEAWLNSFGAVMDAAALVVTTVEVESVGSAKLMLMVGYHLVEDMNWFFRFKTGESEPGIEQSEFEHAVSDLELAGYKCKPPEAAWVAFSEVRGRYASSLHLMADRFAIVPARWIGDRTYAPHRSGGLQRQLTRHTHEAQDEVRSVEDPQEIDSK